MAKFSQRSASRLASCDQRLQAVFNEVIKHVDCTVLEGHRREARQNELFRSGMSKLQWPDSKHNFIPSLAADVVPYPIDWENLARFSMFAGFVLGTGASMGLPLRAGIDWDGDFNPKNNWIDAAHYELVG